MSEDYTQGLERFRSFRAWYETQKSNRNEATTRLHLIDKIFFDCLGWSRDETDLEDSLQGKYADYCFSAPRKVLILEAKREGDYFNVPAGKDQSEQSISALIHGNNAVKAALLQVAGYCQERGVPIGAISNGTQIIAFMAARNDGVAPLKGRCIVFPSLEVMEEKFLDLWNLLSKEGVSERNLWTRLLGVSRSRLPEKLSATLPTYPGVRRRNLLQTDLKTLADLVIEDISRTRELEKQFLTECYCQSGSLSQHALVTKKFLLARYSAIFDPEQHNPTTSPATVKNGTSNLLTEAVSRRPILLLGDVGVGKTTFMRQLVKVEAPELLQKTILLHIDLGSSAVLAQDLKVAICDLIETQLREEYSIDIDERQFVRGVYDLDLKRFGKSIYSDKKAIKEREFRRKELELLDSKLKDRPTHIKKSVEHIARGQAKQIVVFLDNADQRDDETQQETFLVAQEIAEHWDATVFVALRPETYHRSKRHGALSGYHSKAFTIAPPRIDDVLLKRLAFALKLTTGEIRISGLSDEVNVQLATLDKMIRILLDSLNRNEDLLEFIDNVSAGNVRLALEFVNKFLSSGHIDTRKMLEIYETKRKYIVPLHEFMRAVIYGDARYYAPRQSPVANLFDLIEPQRKEHFLLPICLWFIDETAHAAMKDGFLEADTIYEAVQHLGFTPDQIDAALIRGLNHNLIETSARKIFEDRGERPTAFRLTTIGAYHIRKLITEFAYLDAIIVDTPILDSESRTRIVDCENIVDRLARTKELINYLDECWKGILSTDSFFKWEAISQKAKVQIDKLESKLKV